jgi:ketosteroid isomerase-like protein
MSSAADLQATNRVFEEEVVGKGNFGMLTQVYTRDARILPPGAPMMKGQEEIQAFWKNAAVALDVKSLKLETVEAEFLGDTAIEIGAATISTNAGGSMEVKYVVVWKKEDGGWKWHIDIWNPVQ